MSEPRADQPRLWARKGEQVSCLNGHSICDIARDLYVGESRSGDHFSNWRQLAPDVKASVADIRCTECKSVWVRGNPREGYQFHFEGGWR